jgi:hypothetical protein
MRITERHDDASGKTLAPPYCRVRVQVQRVEEDESNPLGDGKPGNVTFFNKDYDFESVKEATLAVKALGETALVKSGRTPELKTVPTTA